MLKLKLEDEGRANCQTKVKIMSKGNAMHWHKDNNTRNDNVIIKVSGAF